MRARILCAALILVSGAMTARADTVSDQIAHLIGFVRGSACTFIRNGSNYDGNAAADHIQQKYDYYKSDIHSAEDFLDRAATKSLMSGKPYQVRCGNGPVMPAADWLRTELAAYRAGTSAN